MRTKHSLLTFLFFIPLLSFSQSWEKHFDYQDKGARNGLITETDDGGIIVAGNSKDSINNLGIYIFKLDEFGDTIWTNFYPLDTVPIVKKIVQVENANFIILGQMGNFWNSSGIKGTVCIMKFNSEGNLLSDNRYEAENNSNLMGEGLVYSHDGNYVFSGYRVDLDMQDFRRTILTKINPDGDIIWKKKYTESQVHSTKNYDLTQTSDSGFLLTNSNNHPIGIKTDSEGELKWAKKYEPFPASRISSVELENGNFAIGGTSVDTSGWMPKLLIIDTLGNIISKDTLSNLHGYDVWDMNKTSDGGVIFTGWLHPPLNLGIGLNTYIIKLDNDFNISFVKDFSSNSQNNDEGHNIMESKFGGYLISSNTFYAGVSTPSDIFVIRTDEFGTVSNKFLPRKNKIKVYPNPSFDKFHFEDIEYIKNGIIIITDSGGKFIHSFNPFTTPEVNLSGNPNGFYFYTYMEGNKIKYSGTIFLINNI